MNLIASTNGIYTFGTSQSYTFFRIFANLSILKVIDKTGNPCL